MMIFIRLIMNCGIFYKVFTVHTVPPVACVQRSQSPIGEEDISPADEVNLVNRHHRLGTKTLGLTQTQIPHRDRITEDGEIEFAHLHRDMKLPLEHNGQDSDGSETEGQDSQEDHGQHDRNGDHPTPSPL